MCPPGTDQTTRGPQRWTVLCPRLKQQHRLFGTVNRWRQARKPSSPKDGWDVWGKLARPDPLAAAAVATGNSQEKVDRSGNKKGKGTARAEVRVDITVSDRAESKSNRSQAGCKRKNQHPETLIKRNNAPKSLCDLEALPLELMQIILSQLAAADLVTLAQTSTTLLAVVLPHITASLVGSYGFWAGQEIAATGTWLTTVPKSFMKNGLAFHACEVPWLIERAEQEHGLNPNHWMPMRGMCAARSMNWRAHSHFKFCNDDNFEESWEGKLPRVENGLTMWRQVIADMETNSRWDEGLPQSARKQIERTISGQGLFPSEAKWMLRDLDTKEVIRCEVKHKSDDNSRLEGWLDQTNGKTGVRLDDFLPRRIQWGAEAAVAGTDMTENRAGNRFEIVSERVHEMDGGDWLDVTAKVVAAFSGKENGAENDVDSDY